MGEAKQRDDSAEILIIPPIGRRHDSGAAAAHLVYRQTLTQLRGDNRANPDSKTAVDLFLRFLEQHAEVENHLLNCGADEETITGYTRDLLHFIAALDRIDGGLHAGSHHHA